MTAAVRIATWNISECVSTDWTLFSTIKKKGCDLELKNITSEIVNLINENQIDIICFQEFPVITYGETNLIDIITSKTFLKHHYECATYKGFLLDDSEIGVGVFSRFPIQNADFTYMKNPNIKYINSSGQKYWTFDKGLITVTMCIFGKPLYVITGHGISFSPFGLNEMDYPECFECIQKCVEQFDSVKDHLLVTGDFNTEFLSDILPSLYNNLSDTLPGPTTISGIMEGHDFGVGRKLDYCLTSHNIFVSSTARIRNFSDHYLCITECILL